VYIGGVAGLISLGTSSASVSAADRLQQTVAAVNKTSPKMVDSETRLDRAESLSDLTLQYDYSMINLVAATLDQRSIETELQGQIRNDIKRKICSSGDMKPLRDMGTTFRYRYNDRNGVLLGVITIPSNECVRGQSTLDEKL
jgi:hypothetical protein